MIEISIAVIALAFVVLVIYLVITLWSVHKTLCELRKTLLSAQCKMDALDPLFKATSLVGDKALECAQRWRTHKCDIDPDEQQRAAPSSKDKLVDIVEWLALGLTLWLNVKKGR